MLTISKNTRASSRRGGILITTLIISTIIASMLAGMGTLLTSYYSRSVGETNYANAINLADAGINYEIRRITTNVSNADLAGTTTPPGSTVAFGNGSFRVYCTMADGVTTWDKSTAPFYIFSTGISGTISRSTRVTCNGYDTGTTPNLAVFGTNSFNFHAPGITLTNGDIGTNGSMSLHGHVPDGSCFICGPGASGSGAGANCPTVNLSSALNFQTVSALALTNYPNSGATAPGGLTYLSLHNDNSKVGLPLLLPSIIGSMTLTGPGNYYITSLNLVGTSVLTCNNTNGPINIWVGPEGGPGLVNFDGTASITTTSSAPANAVTFYVATSAGVQMHTSPTLNANFYAVNPTYGPISGWNSPTINGYMVGYDIFQSGAAIITPNGYCPTPGPYTSFGNPVDWTEIGGM